jgi:hypothetical protein
MTEENDNLDDIRKLYPHMTDSGLRITRGKLRRCLAVIKSVATFVRLCKITGVVLLRGQEHTMPLLGSGSSYRSTVSIPRGRSGKVRSFPSCL